MLHRRKQSRRKERRKGWREREEGVLRGEEGRERSMQRKVERVNGEKMQCGRKKGDA